MLCASSALGWLVIVYPQRPGPGEGGVVSVQLRPGADVDAVAATLHAAGTLTDVRLFGLYLRAMGASGALREGEVMLRDGMSPRTLLRRVARGFGSSELRITIPEGYSRFEIAALLERWAVCDGDGFLAASVDQALLGELGIEATSAEGYLFPDTYLLRDETRPVEILRRLVRNARRRIATLDGTTNARWKQLAASHGWGEYELLTLASVVEMEAGVADERPLIAGVFVNRLVDPEFRPHRLQADPTVAYGCLLQPRLPPCRDFDGRRVTRRMTGDAANRYNTYRHDGLPPGPIGNPGLGSLRAVLAPAQHGHYYFVARGDGRHAFSATLEQHHAAVARFR